MYPGKRIQQSLHFWYHHRWYGGSKWDYDKDYNSDWWYFQTAFHNLPSEKIVDMYYYWWGGQWQLWAFHKLLKPSGCITLK